MQITVSAEESMSAGGGPKTWFFPHAHLYKDHEWYHKPQEKTWSLLVEILKNMQIMYNYHRFCGVTVVIVT